MNHDDIQQLLPAYVDQELGIVDALAVERHLATCAACRGEVETQRGAGVRMRTGAAYFDAPQPTRARVLAALPAARPPRAGWRGWQFWWPAAPAALALALGWGIGTYRALPAPQALTEELVASHVRSLQVDHLADVASSDQHTVKPWFVGKLDFAPPVVDLAAQGFPLTGGRLDYLDGRTVAVLVYFRHRHPINLYVWPGTGMPVNPRAVRWHGYHLAQWSDGAMRYAAVSDVEEGDLAQFVQALRSHGTQR